MVCDDCQNDLEHCHDVLVLHIDGSMQCVSAKCDIGRESHQWYVTCLDAQWPCDCSRVGHTQPLAA